MIHNDGNTSASEKNAFLENLKNGEFRGEVNLVERPFTLLSAVLLSSTPTPYAFQSLLRMLIDIRVAQSLSRGPGIFACLPQLRIQLSSEDTRTENTNTGMPHFPPKAILHEKALPARKDQPRLDTLLHPQRRTYARRRLSRLNCPGPSWPLLDCRRALPCLLPGTSATSQAALSSSAWREPKRQPQRAPCQERRQREETLTTESSLHPKNENSR